MKLLTFIIVTLLAMPVFANPGVIVEAKGGVTINQQGKIIKAQTGAKFSDGVTIEVPKTGSATLMFSNGSIKKLAGGEKFVAAKTAPGQSSGGSIVNGIAMAYNDATKASKGPTVHGMVKAVPGEKAATAKGDSTLSPEKSSALAADLKQIDSLGLEKDGQSLMQAQVYYKYQQYQRMVNLLVPVYRAQTPPTDMVKNLLVLGFQKMGKSDEAKKYR